MMTMSSHSLQFAFRSRPHCPHFRGIRVSENPKLTSSTSSPSHGFFLRSNSKPVFCGGLHSQLRRRLAKVSQRNATSESEVSTSASLRLPIAAEVVRDFYDGINRRDLESVESLICEECVYEDLIFSKPFVGRKAIMEFFKNFTDSISSELQFVIDDISGEDTSATGVTWHLEWRGRPFPFSKGCSFYRLDVSEGTRKIIYARDCVEPAAKPGAAALAIISAVTWLLQRFPQLADRL
ncbi:hypothetical protein KFK09_022510 [Dendrobium nobile]|uniref:SnoaL-like domain-containing protein n=1 Tax=Dendrobium nobile TaxID=94219 RepID=A0A8T3AJJ4_DENNO|nr:hypothetical protein KFK09_022510 [Dendrobium nobile]